MLIDVLKANDAKCLQQWQKYWDQMMEKDNFLKRLKEREFKNHREREERSCLIEEERDCELMVKGTHKLGFDKPVKFLLKIQAKTEYSASVQSSNSEVKYIHRTLVALERITYDKDMIERYIKPEIVEAAKKLDPKYPDSYKKFFNKYGTHFISMIDFGGKRDLSLAMNKRTKATRAKLAAECDIVIKGILSELLKSPSIDNEFKLQLENKYSNKQKKFSFNQDV